MWEGAGRRCGRASCSLGSRPGRQPGEAPLAPAGTPPLIMIAAQQAQQALARARRRTSRQRPAWRRPSSRSGRPTAAGCGQAGAAVGSGVGGGWRSGATDSTWDRLQGCRAAASQGRRCGAGRGGPAMRGTHGAAAPLSRVGLPAVVRAAPKGRVHRGAAHLTRVPSAMVHLFRPGLMLRMASSEGMPNCGGRERSAARDASGEQSNSGADAQDGVVGGYAEL